MGERDVGGDAGVVRGDPIAASAAAPCPLCKAEAGEVFLEEPGRTYSRCPVCRLIHLHAEHRPRPLAEVRRYLEHRNDGADAGYVDFLRRLADPVCAAVPVGARGLDCGCGPAPVLSELLTESGRPTVAYDPLFFPDDALFDARYDFVTCSEVVEHAHDPAALFQRMADVVRSGGTIGVMTRMYGAEAPFERWWYRRDPTHVCFYDADTMRWIAGHHGWTLALPAPNVALFTTAA